MNEQEKQDLTAVIHSRMQQLRDIAATGEVDSDGDQVSADGGNPQVVENAKRELRCLKISLEWLDSDGGGYCENCGCEIPVGRLKAVPNTRLCIHCMKAQ